MQTDVQTYVSLQPSCPCWIIVRNDLACCFLAPAFIALPVRILCNPLESSTGEAWSADEDATRRVVWLRVVLRLCESAMLDMVDVLEVFRL